MSGLTNEQWQLIFKGVAEKAPEAFKDCIKGVMTLSLHIVQQMRKMGGDEV